MSPSYLWSRLDVTREQRICVGIVNDTDLLSSSVRRRKLFSEKAETHLFRLSQIVFQQDRGLVIIFRDDSLRGNTRSMLLFPLGMLANSMRSQKESRANHLPLQIRGKGRVARSENAKLGQISKQGRSSAILSSGRAFGWTHKSFV